MHFEHNCLNLAGILDAPLYRIFPVDRLFEILSARQLTLVRPHLWDDPFENFLYRIKVVSKDGHPVSIDGLRRRLFGQCWSLTEESDAMWRIYSPTKNGVKVKTTARKLMKAIYDESDTFASLKFFIGKVEYEEEATLISLFENPDHLFSLITDNSGLGPVKALLQKRREFIHENEVRLIFQHTDEVAEDIQSFSIDPFDLFDELVFDPRMSEHIFNAFKSYAEVRKFVKPICQSKLYQLPTPPKLEI